MGFSSSLRLAFPFLENKGSGRSGILRRVDGSMKEELISSGQCRRGRSQESSSKRAKAGSEGEESNSPNCPEALKAPRFTYQFDAINYNYGFSLVGLRDRNPGISYDNHPRLKPILMPSSQIPLRFCRILISTMTYRLVEYERSHRKKEVLD